MDTLNLQNRLQRRLSAIEDTHDVTVIDVREEDVVYATEKGWFVRRYYVDWRDDIWLYHEAEPVDEDNR